ncbi:hypothetical protein RCL1_000232 [Eukaryota sp. TZLM3-RCL]
MSCSALVLSGNCRHESCGTSLSDYSFHSGGDSGSQSVCKILSHKVTKKKYFLKSVLKDSGGGKQELAHFTSPIDSPFLVKYHHCFEDLSTYSFLMDYHETGSLLSFIENERNANNVTPFITHDIGSIFFQLLSGVADLHRSNIIHRDLKLGNILMESKTRPFRVRICDYGICKQIDGTIGRTLLGTPGFIAPEVQNGQTYGFAADLFSLGVVLYHLTEGRYPFCQQPHPYHNFTDFNSTLHIHPDNAFRDVLIGLLQLDPSNRPTIDDLFIHPVVLFSNVCFLQSEVSLLKETSSLQSLQLVKANDEIDRLSLLLTAHHEISTSREDYLRQMTEAFESQTQSHIETINAMKRTRALDNEATVTEVNRLSQLFSTLQDKFSNLESEHQKLKQDYTVLKSQINPVEASTSVISSPNIQSTPTTKAKIEQHRQSPRGRIRQQSDLSPQLNNSLSPRGHTELGLRRKLRANQHLIQKVPKVNGQPDWQMLEKVQQLNLSHSTFFKCLEGIQLWRGLNVLYLNNTSIDNISLLSSCPQLTKLDLSNTSVTDISPLSMCRQLTILYISHTLVSDISPLASCTELTQLDLSSTSVADISSLSCCVYMTTLHLTSTSITSVSPLAVCSDLSLLYLTSTAVRDVSPLSVCTKLKYLDISGTKVTETVALDNITSLEIVR